MTGKSWSMEWGARFPCSSLSDIEAFPTLISPCGAEDLLLVAWEGHHCQAFAELSSVLGKARQH